MVARLILSLVQEFDVFLETVHVRFLLLTVDSIFALSAPASGSSPPVAPVGSRTRPEIVPDELPDAEAEEEIHGSSREPWRWYKEADGIVGPEISFEITALHGESLELTLRGTPKSSY